MPLLAELDASLTAPTSENEVLNGDSVAISARANNSAAGGVGAFIPEAYAQAG